MVSSPERLPLTEAQRAVWIGQQLHPASPLYNAAECVTLEGPLDIGCFQLAVHYTVAEAEAAHVRFVPGAEGVTQVLAAPAPWTMPLVDLSHEDDPVAAAWSRMRTDLRTVTDLEHGPLFAHTLFVLGEDRFLWYHRAHHIVLDGYSFCLVTRRVARHYSALVEQHRSAREPPFPPLRVAIDDEFTYRSSDQYGKDRDFWTEYAAGHPPAAGLSDRDVVSCDKLLRHSGQLPEKAVNLWRHHDTNWVAVVLALVAIYVRRHTGVTEVVLGVPVMGRLGTPAARVPSMTMNIVPLRVRLEARGSLRDHIAAVSSQIRRVWPHRRYRGEQLRRDLGLFGEGSRLYGPIVNVMPFDYDLSFTGLRAVSRNVSAGAGFLEDMAIHIHIRGAGQPIVMDIDANPHRYEPSELAAHVGNLTEVLSVDPAWEYTPAT